MRTSKEMAEIFKLLGKKRHLRIIHCCPICGNFFDARGASDLKSGFGWFCSLACHNKGRGKKNPLAPPQKNGPISLVISSEEKLDMSLLNSQAGRNAKEKT